MGRAMLFVDRGFCDRAHQSLPHFADRRMRRLASWPLTRIPFVGDPPMYAVYVLEDTWRLRATFSTRGAADILAARLVSRGERAKVFRTADTQRRAA